MKKYLLILLSALFLLASCGGNKVEKELPPPPGYEQDDTGGGGDEPDIPQKHDPVTPGSEWKKVSLSDGLIWYSFKGKDPISNAMQAVNVVDLDLSKTRYSLKFYYGNKTPDSSVMKSTGAVVTMNAGYEMASIVVKVNGSMVSNMPANYIPDTQVPNWKSEGAVFTDGERDVQIEFCCKDMAGDLVAQRKFYLAEKRRNIISSAPVLVDNYNPVGLTFAKTNVNVNSLEYEDPNRHQGVRHPRTAVAKTEFGHFLLITVDGRQSGVAEGMTAKELTSFLVKHFDPQYALNMDGGGSTTMCIAGQGAAETHVVNVPSESTGERSVPTHFYIIDSQK